MRRPHAAGRRETSSSHADMSAGKIIGLGLVFLGGAVASLVWIQLLFQQDSSALPVQIGLPAAIGWVVGGAAAVRVGLRMAAMPKAA